MLVNTDLLMSNSGPCVGQMVDEQMSEPEDESEVKVLVLSPRCWAISAPCYLENPSKYFPQRLCNYLDEFTDFYSNSKFRIIKVIILGYSSVFLINLFKYK